MKNTLLGIVAGVVIAFVLGLIIMPHSEESSAIAFLIFGGVVGGFIGAYPLIKEFSDRRSARKERNEAVRLERERLEFEEMERQRELDNQSAEQEQKMETEEEKWDPETVRQIRANKITNLVIAIVVVLAIVAIIIWRIIAWGA